MAVLALDDSFEEISLFREDGLNAFLHTVSVDQYEYGVFYVPISAGFFAQQGMVEQELGRRLPQETFEIKFALKRDFDAGYPEFTLPEDWSDLGSLDYSQMMALGQGIFQSTWMFRGLRHVKGFVAVALEDRPRLAAYYGRLLRKYQGQLHFDVHLVQGGSGYAIF